MILTRPIQSQGIVTNDSVSVDISAVAYYEAVDAAQSMLAIENVAATIAAEAEAMAEASLGQASDTIMAHPLALQLGNLQTLGEIGVDKNSTVVFPPLMSTIGELGTFLNRESAAARQSGPADVLSYRTTDIEAAGNGSPVAVGK